MTPPGPAAWTRARGAGSNGLVTRGHPGADLIADLAAIDGSFGVLAGEDTFARGRDERMNYLARLADA